MAPRLKSILQYVVILGVTVLLTYLSLRGINVAEGENKWDYLKHTWQSAHKGWLMLMAVIALASHLLRAERWRMLLVPVGFKAKLSNSLLSLMVGYLVNLVIPRGGEISRCYNLYKLDKIPVVESFGTVVIERIVDLICLLILIALSFAFESQKLLAFMETLPFDFSGGSKLQTLLGILVVGIIFLLLGYLFVRKSKKLKQVIRKTLSSFRDGILSVFKLENKPVFIFYSVMIWLLYFAMSYAVLKAFPSTSNLPMAAVLSLFAIGSIAMAAPLPGGTGSYHVLVPQGLFFLYQIPLSDAVAFTFIFHAWQTLIMIIFGAASLFITSFLVKKGTESNATQN